MIIIVLRLKKQHVVQAHWHIKAADDAPLRTFALFGIVEAVNEFHSSRPKGAQDRSHRRVIVIGLIRFAIRHVGSMESAGAGSIRRAGPLPAIQGQEGARDLLD